MKSLQKVLRLLGMIDLPEYPVVHQCPSIESVGTDSIIKTRYGLGAARTIEDFGLSLQVNFSQRRVFGTRSLTDDNASFTAGTDGRLPSHPFKSLLKNSLIGRSVGVLSDVLHHSTLLCKDDQRAKTMLAALLIVESNLAKYN